MDWVVNPCGGVPWRTLADGKVEIQGLGVPEYAPTSSQAKMLLQTWANWKPLFQAAAKRYGIPARWIAATATMETGGWAVHPDQQRTITSSDGFLSVGIMQPIASVATMYGYDPAERTDPAKNVDMGSHLLADNTKRAGVLGAVAMASYYNAGHLCPNANNLANGCYDATLNMAGCGHYPLTFTRYNNLAVTLGIVDTQPSGVLGTLAPAAAGIALVALGWWVWQEFGHR